MLVGTIQPGRPYNMKTSVDACGRWTKDPNYVDREPIGIVCRAVFHAAQEQSRNYWSARSEQETTGQWVVDISLQSSRLDYVSRLVYKHPLCDHRVDWVSIRDGRPELQHSRSAT